MGGETMVREIIHDPIFLRRKSLNATAADLPIAEDLVDTLQANADRWIFSHGRQAQLFLQWALTELLLPSLES